MFEVTCMCGYVARGTEEECVTLLQEHGRTDHGGASSREKILSMAVPVSGDADV